MNTATTWFLIGLATPIIVVLVGLLVGRIMSINAGPDEADDTRIADILRAADQEQERRKVRGLS